MGCAEEEEGEDALRGRCTVGAEGMFIGEWTHGILGNAIQSLRYSRCLALGMYQYDTMFIR